MTTLLRILRPSKGLVALAFASFLLPGVRADGTGAAEGQRQFASPDDAVKALVTAAKSDDRAAVDAIFGPQVKGLLSGDAKQDTLEFGSFARSVGQYAQLVQKGDDRYIVDIGPEDWPMPIPLVRAKGSWYFDTTAGKEEVLSRRIGKDELTAIGVCRTYVVAQREYASEDRDGSGVVKYAQKLRSSTGMKDGLYWKASDDEEQSPFGPLVAEARAEGYRGKTVEGGPQPFHGYLFKILTSQGSAAPGGAYDYIINGNMVAGFALVAYPAHWGESGIMTFIVNQSGKVYQCNFGPESADIASTITSFNPDAGWTAVDSP
ncbi:MAG TPA: DUF2950 domain-containing protein [Opitutaceae bacterium]|jgi:hypothetical protein